MNEVLKILKALSDKNRLRVVMVLHQYQELCACQITELLQIKGATVSRHLGILINAELISSRKDGRWVYYKLTPSKAEFLLNWISQELGDSKEIQDDTKRITEIIACLPEQSCQ